MNFLKDAPVAHFTKEDHQLFQATLKRTLDAAKDGELQAWENPKSGAHGTVTADSSSISASGLCRQAKIANSAGGLTSEFKFKFCRQKDGEWRMSP
jgi:surface antigen